MDTVPEGDPPQTPSDDSERVDGSEPPVPTSPISSKEQELCDAITSLLDRAKELQEKAGVYSNRLKSEGDSMGEQAKLLEKEVKELRRQVNGAVENDEVSSDKAGELEDELLRARSMIYEGDVAAVLPHKANGLFLGLFLGHVNVRSARKDVRYKVKEEYNAYRDRTALLFLAFPLILLLLKHRLWKGCFPGFIVHLYQAWLLFFYTSLALRENVLRVNGSDIRPWWIFHHYYAMLMALISLTWGIEGPDCAEKQAGVSLFLTWAVMQGVAMLLQNRYQRQRLYTRIALGKAGRMDVVWGETSGVKGQLWLLYPLLFLLQGFQLYIGGLLLQSALYEFFEWQILASGVLLIMMAIGNFTNTVATLATKARIKAKMKKKGRKMLERMSSSPGLSKKES